MHPQTAVCFTKRREQSAGITGDFVAASIPDQFIIGYCLDYNEKFRDMDHVCVINQKGIDTFKDT